MEKFDQESVYVRDIMNILLRFITNFIIEKMEKI